MLHSLTHANLMTFNPVPNAIVPVDPVDPVNCNSSVSLAAKPIIPDAVKLDTAIGGVTVNIEFAIPPTSKLDIVIIARFVEI